MISPRNLPACDCGWMVGDAGHKEHCAQNQIDFTQFTTDQLSEHYFHPWSHESRVAVRAELVKRGVLCEREGATRRKVG